ncbi:hypothetical protein BDQ17DRAFT_1216419, partial [Cyathus striatus]
FSYLILYHFRILLSCLKYLGINPCPCCKLEKSLIRYFGSAQDMSRRIKLARIDDEGKREAVSQARRLIFTQG